MPEIFASVILPYSFCCSLLWGSCLIRLGDFFVSCSFSWNFISGDWGLRRRKVHSGRTCTSFYEVLRPTQSGTTWNSWPEVSHVQTHMRTGSALNGDPLWCHVSSSIISSQRVLPFGAPALWSAHYQETPFCTEIGLSWLQALRTPKTNAQLHLACQIPSRQRSGFSILLLLLAFCLSIFTSLPDHWCIWNKFVIIFSRSIFSCL